MRSPSHQRGLTLVETLVAMAVMLIGAAGLAGLNKTALRLNSDARRMTHATAIAQDLMSQIDTWSYTDARLANANTANDGNVGDTAFAFEKAGAPPADHGEADLTAGGAAWYGIPSAELLQAGFERYWNISYQDPDPAAGGALLDLNGNGVADAVRIAVIVRWRHGAGWRRVVLVAFKQNPAEVL